MAFRTSTPKQLEDEPSLALAVREFGVGVVKLDVGVVKGKSGDLYAMLADPTKAFACPATASDLPAFVLRAEVVSLRDGRLIAHIDESRPLRPPGDLKRSIITSTTSTDTVKDAYGRESAVNQTTDVTCENAQHELAKLVEDIRRSQVARAAGEDLLKAGLGPVFR